jgi:hypothetical protein
MTHKEWLAHKEGQKHTDCADVTWYGRVHGIGATDFTK